MSDWKKNREAKVKQQNMLVYTVVLEKQIHVVFKIKLEIKNAKNQWSQELVFWYNKYIDPILVKLNTTEKYDPI